MADAHVETSDLNQDSLDGNSASNSEVGSQESSPEIVASNEVITPTLSTGTDEDSGASAEVTEAVPAAAASAPAEESREAEGATEDAAPKKAAENGTNGDSADHQHVNGKSASNPEADSTEVDAAAGEKRKSLPAEEVTISPKKVKVDEDEAAAPVVEDIAPTNGAQEAATV